MMATRKLHTSPWSILVLALFLIPYLGGCDDEAGPAAPSIGSTATEEAAFDPYGPASTTAVPGPVAFDQAFDLVSTEGCTLPGGSYARFTRRMVAPTEGTHLLNTTAGFEPCNDAPEDARNSFTWAQDGTTFTWSATVPVGAVILQSGSASRVYQYGQRSWGDEGLVGPTDPSTGAALPVDAVVLCHDYAVQVQTQIEARLVTRIDWSMQGAVAGASWDLFPGDHAVSRVDLQLQAGAPVSEPPTVVGTVTITNDSPLPARVTSVMNFFSGGYIIPIDFSVTLPVDLAPGQTLEGHYWQPLPNQQTRTNTVTVNCVGDVRGGSARAELVFGERVTEGATATVVSSDGRSFGPYTSSTALAVEREFVADRADPSVVEVPWDFRFVDDQGEYATTITVRRHDPHVDLVAQTRFARRWCWFLEHGLVNGELSTFTTSRESVGAWLRAGTDGGTDSDFGVSGSLRITNPHPARALEIESSRVMIARLMAPVVDEVATIEAADARITAFDVELESGTANTALANILYVTRSFAADGRSMPRGVEQLEQVVALEFEDPSTEIDSRAWLGDTLGGDLGEVSAASGPVEVQYLVPLDLAAECGTSQVDGTGRLMTIDTGTVFTAPYTITVEIDCGEQSACTRGRGYWMHHREDPAWSIVSSESAMWFLRNGRAFEDILQVPSKGDPYWQLATAWVVARLNQRAGADATVVAQQLGLAADLLSQERPVQLRGRDATQWHALADMLQDFNEGRVGPGACED